MKLTLSLPLFLAILMVAGAALGGQAPQGEHKVRIGTYDNRSVAVAFVRWRLNPMQERKAEYEAAMKAGDEKRAKELAAWGEKQQRRAHRQGFARVPVDDLLAHVRGGVEQLARERDLDAIAWFCDYGAPGVELVDVTEDLVRLFEPSEATLKVAREVREHEPLDLDEIEGEHDH